MVEVDDRLSIVGEPVVEGKIVGDHQMGVGRYVCDSCVCESELDEIWMLTDLFGGTVHLSQFRNERLKEDRTLPTGLFGKLSQKIADLGKNWGSRHRRLKIPEEPIEKLEIVRGERVGSRKPINSIWILCSNDMKQVGVDNDALRPVLKAARRGQAFSTERIFIETTSPVSALILNRL